MSSLMYSIALIGQDNKDKKLLFGNDLPKVLHDLKTKNTVVGKVTSQYRNRSSNGQYSAHYSGTHFYHNVGGTNIPSPQSHHYNTALKIKQFDIKSIHPKPGRSSSKIKHDGLTGNTVPIIYNELFKVLF